MSAAGDKTEDLRAAELITEIVANDEDGTCRQSVGKLATQLAFSGAISDEIDRVEGLVTSGGVSVSGWARLQTIDPGADGTGGEVVAGDAGTHLQATATGYDGQEVPNEGRYSWVDAWSRWSWIGPTGLSAKADAAAVAALEADLRDQLSALDITTLELIRDGQTSEAIARLALLRADQAEARLANATYQIDNLLERLEGVEQATATMTEEVSMNTFYASQTVSQDPVVLIAEGDVRFAEIVNRGLSGKIGISFGVEPATVGEAMIQLSPGRAFETVGAPATPIYVVAEAASTKVNAHFTVPKGKPNPNWADDMDALIARLGGVASLEWQNAIRVLYSDFRALRLLGPDANTLGFTNTFAPAGAAALQNWAADNQAVEVAGPIPFEEGRGFVLNGESQYLNPGLQIGGYTNARDVTIIVWPDKTPQGGPRAAVGDNVCILEPNRAEAQASIKAAVGDNNSDLISISALGEAIGFTGVNDDDYTVHKGGGFGEVAPRDGLTNYPVRDLYFGANNTGNGAADFYTGSPGAMLVAKAASAEQVLGAMVAMAEYQARVEAILAAA